MKMLRILTIIFLSIYKPLWANDTYGQHPDRIIIAKGNMISVKKLNIENNLMLLKNQEDSFESFFGLVFDGIIQFEKGKRRNDPKGYFKRTGPINLI